ncbi:MAG: hypothetical protein QW290_10180 [Sulfolobales archaeon]
MQAESPLDIMVRFLGTEVGDIVELIPMVERIDGKTIKYEANHHQDPVFREPEP